jgi:hypothetical protein
MKSSFTLIVASAACLLTFFVVRRVLSEQLKLGPPTLLAALVAGLAFLGLVEGGEGLVSALLVPYEALAVTLLILFLLLWLFRFAQCRFHRSRTPGESRGWDSKRSGPSPWNPASQTGISESGLPRCHPPLPGSTDPQARDAEASAKGTPTFPMQSHLHAIAAQRQRFNNRTDPSEGNGQ